MELRDKLIEACADVDEAIMEKFLDGKADEVLGADLRGRAQGARCRFKFVPVLCGSAFKNKGVQLLLDAVVNFLPSPLDIPPVKGVAPEDETQDRGAQGRRQGAVRGARVQDHERPVRRQR